ncbi:hypothetical protein DL762_004014 [Monosporascus cannonballus]|uniref:DUF7137 domain-containing protein n=1 Tax=Monosporascus cannonballus TaxID=155416 RepID=A0ABY0H9B8_9PEZI|nr:hypothetical protein DL762_004014 [Monosporascus cannonballus]
MKGPRSFRQLLTVAVALSPLASAWSNLLPDVDALVVRQDDATTTAERTAETTRDNNSEATTTRDGDRTTTESPRPTDDETTTTRRGPTTTNLNTGGTRTGTRSGSDSSEPTRTTYNPMDGAGSVVMVTPAITDGFQLYKIENPTPITWVWNYTQLQGKPTAIDVKVSCSVASATWTLTQNMTFRSPATFTWDTANFQTPGQDALLTEQYTLLVHDSDSSPTDQAEPGYLAPFDGFRFGLYRKGRYEPLNEWDCVTCSAAHGDLDRKALGFAVSMSAITVLTFTWYVAGFAGLL